MKLLSITVDELIQALQIFQKYTPTGKIISPTYGNVGYCDEHIRVKGYNESDISKHDIDNLSELGFKWNGNEKCFIGREYNPNK